MKYFKAEIFLATEEYWINPKTGETEGCDPDTYQDHGLIITLRASTLEDLIKKIEKEYFKLDKAEIVEGRVEFQREIEHNYNTPLKDRVNGIEMYSIQLLDVDEIEIDANTLIKNKKC